MADYATLKVPELKKLLQEKQLPVTGNKADLIARLQEHDKTKEAPNPTAAPVSAEEDPIDYSDDDVPAAKPEPAAETASAVEKVAEPALEAASSTNDASAFSGEEKAAQETTGEAKPTEAEAEAAPKTDFSAHLPASSADDETRKRAERAKRFGIVETADTETTKKAERAQRFGLDQSSLVSGLDSALPEKRERKRGREGAPAANPEGERGAKRQQNGSGKQRGGGRDNRARGGRPTGRDRNAPRKEGGGAASGRPKRIIDDPSERAKAEARAKRFGGGQ